MTRTTLLAVAALLAMGACMKAEPVTGRADNDLLRFSTMDYTRISERAQ